MKNLIYIIILLVLPYRGIAQWTQFEILDGDTINILDENKEKQKFWKVFGRMKDLPGYEPDQVVEQGIYENDIPQGLWEHFGADGKIAFVSYYVNGIDTVTGASNNKNKNYDIKNLVTKVANLKEQLAATTKVNTELKTTNEQLQSANKQHEEELESAATIKYALFGCIGLLIVIILVLYSRYRKNRG